MYGEGLDISGSSLTWLKSNSSKLWWKLGYQHGVVDTLTTKVLEQERPQSWVHLVQHHSHIKHSRQEQHQSLVQAHKQEASKSGFDFASLFNLDMKEPVGEFNSGFSGGFDFMDGLSFLEF